MKPQVRIAFDRITDPRAPYTSVDVATVRHALERGAFLEELINSPETEDFLMGVKIEAAHQVEKWGEAHDRGKSAENWFWLVGYLAGKCLRAAITGDRVKALHHTISSAAALANWHRAIKTDQTGAGLGDDRDMIEIARFTGTNLDAIGAGLADESKTVHYLGGAGHGSGVKMT